jgi:hypothetical protein
MADERSAAVTWPGRADHLEGCFSGKPCARGNVKNAHTRCDVSRAQQERYEVGCDARESSIVSCRRFILVGQFLCHTGASI